MWVLQCTVSPADNGGSCPAANQVWIEMAAQANPFALGTQGAIDISVGILGVWAVAWVFAQLSRVLKRTDEGQEPG